MEIPSFIIEKPFESITAFCTLIFLYLQRKDSFSKSVSVEWSDELEIFPISSFRLGSAKYQHQQNHDAYLYKIDITNPSNVDIGYFDLVAVDPNNHHSHMIMMQMTVAVPFRNESLILSQNGIDMILQMPPSNNGTFRANSSTHFDIVVTSNPQKPIKDGIQIVFRVAYKSLKSRFYSLLYFLKLKKRTTFYHTFSKIYTLPK